MYRRLKQPVSGSRIARSRSWRSSELAGLLVGHLKRRVQNGSRVSVRAADLQLELADGPCRAQQRCLLGTPLRVDEQAGRRMLGQLLERRDAEDLQERQVGVEDPPVCTGDVDAFAEIRDELGERSRVVQALHGDSRTYVSSVIGTGARED
jgi:hypothetical protein